MKAKEAVGRKVRYKSPSTGHTYEGVVKSHPFNIGTRDLRLELSKDYTEFDLRLGKGHLMSLDEESEVS